jgi:protein SCO1/2
MRALGPHRVACVALLFASLLFARGTLAAPAAAGTPLPRDSMYALTLPLERADGVITPLASFRGHPLLLAMFYSQCNSACPLLVERVRALVQALPPAQRERLSILLVSLDPTHDTPAALVAFAAQHRIGGDHWTLARARANDTRALATVLGIRYRNNSDGSITHSAPIAVFDADGVLVARTMQLAAPDADFEAALQRALAE